MQPSGQPTTQPSGQPTNRPSGQPSMQPTGQPTTQPSGLPTTQPSGQPTTVPSGQPSGVPTSVPSGQPTGEPSSSPTREAVTVTYANGTSFEISNNGLHFVSTRTFDQLGLEERQTFLSAYVWDTGFGPSTGQYVEFSVSGLPGGSRVPVLSSNGSAVHCAPRKADQPSCLRQQWSACFYNFDVTGVLNSLGGKFSCLSPALRAMPSFLPLLQLALSCSSQLCSDDCANPTLSRVFITLPSQ